MDRYRGYFITTWKTDNPGSSNNTSIVFPNMGNTNNFEIDWTCDGTFDETVTGSQRPSHDYGTAGTYDVCVRGHIDHFYAPLKDPKKLLAVKQWGTNTWKSMFGFFSLAENADITATDVPDLSEVTNISWMFNGAKSLVGNEKFADWDTSNVTTMSRMFLSAEKFNQPIGNWDTSKVIDMSLMFYQAKNFNNGKPAGEGGAPLNWTTSSVTTINNMFNGAVSFNQNVDSFDISKVNNLSNVFASAIVFNNGDIAGQSNKPLQWDTSNVTTMIGMFKSAAQFNQNLDSWDTSNVTDMSQMFYGAKAFNGNISTWDTSKVKAFQLSFYGSNLNQNIDTHQVNNNGKTYNAWDVSNVEDFYATFAALPEFNQDLNHWDVSSVNSYYSFHGMFTNSPKFNGDIRNWDVSNGTMFSSMFYGATSFNQDISGWDFGSATRVDRMLFSAMSFSDHNYDALLRKWHATRLHTPPAQNNNTNYGLVYYCTAGAERQALIDAGWKITDSGQRC